MKVLASTAIVLPPEEERLETVALFILLRLEVVSVAGKMTPKMQKFVDEYLVDLNATQAAIRAGYSKKTAYSIGVSNLKKPEIQAAIQKRQKSAAEKLEITRERVLKELASIGFAKATDFLTIQGGHVLIKDSDDVAADKLAALASVKEGMYGVEVKLADKARALEMLGKYLGLFDGTNPEGDTQKNTMAREYVVENNDFSEFEHLTLDRVDRNGTHYYTDCKCPKCGGTGNIYYYAHVEGGVCFLCGGSGVHPTQVIVRRAEYQRELDAKRLERARKAAPAVNAAFLEREGFSKDGKTYIVLGDTYAIREDLKAAGAKFSYNLGWHFPEPNPNYATREITKDTIVFQNDEETVTVLRELPNGMLDWPYDVYYLQEYVKRLQEEYKASLMPETKFFGELGQKVELTLALDRRSFFDTQWGSTAIYAFTDAEGHHFIWKTASWPDALTKVNEGDSIVLKGTIKEHNEYKGCKQTVLTRCKIVA